VRPLNQWILLLHCLPRAFNRIKHIWHVPLSTMSKNACRNLCSGGLVNCHALQLPRLYNVYKEQGIIENFEQLLDNIFQPLFEVTKDPSLLLRCDSTAAELCGDSCCTGFSQSCKTCPVKVFGLHSADI